MRTRESDEPQLWPIWAAVAAIVALGTGIVFALLTLLWVALGHPRIGVTQPLSPADQLDLIRIALVVAGGLGGLVALVVAYRRQRLAENENWRAVRAHRQENYQLFNDLYIGTSTLLGHESASVRQAGVYGIDSTR